MAKKANGKIGKIIKFVAALLAIAAFVMMFANQLKAELLGETIIVKNVLWGSKEKIILGTVETKGAIASGISYCVCAVSALGLLVSFITKKGNLLTAISSLLLIACAVLIFLTKTFYLSANNLKEVADAYKLAVGPIVGGICAGLGGLGGLVSLIAK